MSQISNEFRVSAMRNGVVVRASRTHEVADNIRFAAVIEMLNLGFKVDAEELRGVSVSGLETMIADARKVIGADRNMRPIYPGFPKQVQELSTATLIFEQILHYWTAGEFLPNYSDVVRENLPLADMVRRTRDLKVLNAGEAGRFFMRALTTRGVALSDDDRSLLIGSVILAKPDLEDIKAIVRDARNGENIQALIMATAGTVATSEEASNVITALVPEVKNADFVLRIVLAVATTSVEGKEDRYKRAVQNLSDRDAAAVKMITISRPARRVLLNTLGEVTGGFNADSLVARSNLWRRVMRMVHPYSFVEKDAETAAGRAADIIHANIEHKTFNSLVEKGMADGDVISVVTLLAENQPGNLLRRLVALLRLVTDKSQADVLATAIRTHGARSPVTTLVSAYNGIISVNDKHTRITRVAGLTNTLVEVDQRTVPEEYVEAVVSSIYYALHVVLSKKAAPTGAVGIVSGQAVPLVRRDLATTDRVMDRGERLNPVGEGDTIRVFSHWINTSKIGGYMDIGAVILDSDFKKIAATTWNTWSRHRDWSTYSGDKLVQPGDEAPEFIDVDLAKMKKALPNAAWVAMTIQSWSGIKFTDVDMVAGVMLRSKPNSGEVFDARTVETAFRPTTDAFQSVPFAVDLSTGEMVWLDTSSGSTATEVSAENDEETGVVVYDEIARERLTLGQLAALWAEAHRVETTNEAVDRDALVALLN